MNTDFKEVLFKALSENNFLSTKEIYSLFSDMNTQTVSWHIHRLMKEGFIDQIGHGRYSIHVDSKRDTTNTDLLPENLKEAVKLLKESGYEFYISGLDALAVNGFSIQGSIYPSLICTKPRYAQDVRLLLMREFDFAVYEKDILDAEVSDFAERTKFYILDSNTFELSSDGFALPEKAFVDLYFAITRLHYPVSREALPRILSRINPNEYKFKVSTRDRGLSDELNFLLNYDRRFIKALSSYIQD